MAPIRQNPYYLKWVNKIGLPYADALLALMLGTEQQQKDARQFVDWVNKQTQTRHTGGKRK